MWKTHCQKSCGICTVDKETVTGDPKATNMKGENFEILQTGTFAFLAVTHAVTAQSLLSLDAQIDLAGVTCGATYIKNITLKGQWIEAEGFKEVGVRAKPNTRKKNSLELGFDQEWGRAVTKKPYGIDSTGPSFLRNSSAYKIVLDFHGVLIDVGIDAHRIRNRNNRKTKAFANFLNVNILGAKNLLKEKDVRVSGLLAYDDHADAVQAPNGCVPHSNGKHTKNKPTKLTDTSVTEEGYSEEEDASKAIYLNSDNIVFLSSARLNMDPLDN